MRCGRVLSVVCLLGLFGPVRLAAAQPEAPTARSPAAESPRSISEQLGLEPLARTIKRRLQERESFLAPLALVLLAAPGLAAGVRVLLRGIGRRGRLTIALAAAAAVTAACLLAIDALGLSMLGAAGSNDLPLPRVVDRLGFTLVLPVATCAAFIWTRGQRWDVVWHALVWTGVFALPQLIVTLGVPLLLDREYFCCGGAIYDRGATLGFTLSAFLAALVAGTIRSTQADICYTHRLPRLSLPPRDFWLAVAASSACLLAGYALVGIFTY